MARPLARDGNESNRIGSSMLKRFARNIARRGRGPSLPINDMKRKRRRAAAIFRIEVLEIRIHTIYIIAYHPNKKKNCYHTLYFVGSWSEKSKKNVTCQWHTRKKKHPSHGTVPPGVVFFFPRAISWLLPSFRPAALVAFVAGTNFSEATNRWAPDDRGKNWGFFNMS